MESEGVSKIIENVSNESFNKRKFAVCDWQPSISETKSVEWNLKKSQSRDHSERYHTSKDFSTKQVTYIY